MGARGGARAAGGGAGARGAKGTKGAKGGRGAKGVAANGSGGIAPAGKKQARVASMSADEFLDGDFLDADADASDDGASSSGSESESESDEEDDEAHVRHLEALTKKDPEFYKFLEQNDSDLLKYEGTGDEDVEEDEEDEEDEDEEEEGDEEDEPKAPRNVVTVSQVDAWFDAAMRSGDVDATRAIVRAFRAACYHGDDMDGRGEESLKVDITTSSVFTRVMTRSLTSMHKVFAMVFATGGKHAQQGKGAKGGKDAPSAAPALPKEPEKHSRWKKTVGPLSKSFISSAVHALEQMTDEAMLAFTYRSLARLAPLMRAHERLARKSMTSALACWSRGEGVHARHCAWELLHAQALCMPEGFLPRVLKGMCAGYAANARTAAASEVARVAFQRECVVALCGEDLDAAYTQAFAGLRECANVLRQALQGRAQADARLAQGWRNVGLLELWSAAVCAYPDESELGALAYPLCQLLTGVARLQPSMQRWPLRLRCVRALCDLAEASRCYAPLAAPLVEVLTGASWRRGARGDSGGSGSGGAGVQRVFDSQLLAPKSLAQTRAYQEEAVLRTFELLSRHLAAWSYHIAFPELTLAPMLELRRFAKSCPVERFRKHAQNLLGAVGETAAAVKARRAGVSFAPKDADSVDEFEAEGKRAAARGGKGKRAASAGATAVHAFYVQFKAAAAARKAAGSVDEVTVGGGAPSSQGARAGAGGGDDVDDDDDVDDGDDAMEGDDLSEGEEDGPPSEEDAEGEDEGRGGKARRRAAKPARPAAPKVDVKQKLAAAAADEDGDVLEDVDFDAMFDEAEAAEGAAPAAAAEAAGVEDAGGKRKGKGGKKRAGPAAKGGKGKKKARKA